MAITITPHNHEVFKRNFLKSVVCQIKVQPIFRIASELPAQFQEKVRKDYPAVQEEKSVQVEVRGQETQQRSLGSTWRFRSDDGYWAVTLDSAFIALETKPIKASPI